MHCLISSCISCMRVPVDVKVCLPSFGYCLAVQEMTEGRKVSSWFDVHSGLAVVKAAVEIPSVKNVVTTPPNTLTLHLLWREGCISVVLYNFCRTIHGC